ncbi:membrane protein [Microbacterium phage Mazun]|nr:membrane protein [Microbacterium phage Mazun]
MGPLVFLGLFIMVGLTLVAIVDIVRYERRMRRVNDTINELERGRGRHSS